MKLDDRILALVAIGASVTANCQPCLEHNVGTALKCGADAEQIAEAIRIGKLVRQGAASKMDKFALDLSRAAGTINGECGCS